MSILSNVLLITVDDLNYDSVGCFGCQVDDITPNIDKLASEGVRFNNSHVTIAVCQPSRSVLLTGRYPHHNGARGFEEIDASVTTLTQVLHREGFLNGIIGKEDHVAPKEKFFWDEYVQTYCEEEGWGRSPEVYYDKVKQFLTRAREEGKSFFLMANSHDPHRPYVGADDEMFYFGHHTTADRIYTPEEITVPGCLPDLPDVRKELAQYFSSVHRGDQIVGKILQALDDMGYRDDTLVLFLSDNGMALPYAKTNCYLNSTKSPYIMRWPGFRQRRAGLRHRLYAHCAGRAGHRADRGRGRQIHEAYDHGGRGAVRRYLYPVLQDEQYPHHPPLAAFPQALRAEQALLQWYFQSHIAV